MKRYIIIVCLIIGCITGIYGQDFPWRVGLKAGIPRFGGVNMEYVTPWMQGRLALSTDFSYLKFPEGNITNVFVYNEIGCNFYLMEQGRGLYLNSGYGRYSDEEITFESDPVNAGTIETSLRGISNGLNVKAGFITRGRFYARLEAGYRVGLNHGEINVDYIFPDGFLIHQHDRVPSVVDHAFLLHAGIGISF